MNKELIKKYKAEFDHWLNGGRLLSKHINDKDWYEATDPSFSNINVSYVIYDEYVELRKAIIKGKTIQVWDVIYQHLTDPKLDTYDWRDFKSFTQNSSFTYSPERYRVKPEEPQFKVGDWVIEIHSGGYAKVLDVFTKELRVKLYDCNSIITTENTDFKHWEPKPGEWCWVSTNGTYSLYQYNSTSRSIHDLEPFIGTLPTHLQ